VSETYDFIVVGAGSSGCVLAERLSRDSGNRVLLLEAGGRDVNPMIHVPLSAPMLQKTGVDWNYETAPEPELNNRPIRWPRGKVLGGSSAIHGMIYIRGQREDYETWAAKGNDGWSYEELLPYFRQHEDHEEGANEYHGVDGPLWVGMVAGNLDMAEQFVEAGVDIGLPFNPDFNGAEQEGIGYYPVNIKNGLRQSSATSHLNPNRKRKNLSIAMHALATRILLERGRATGIEYRHKGKIVTAHCSKELVLCGGAVNSPQLLELSGIGDRELLESHGIDVAQHLPGVGENLQDHLTINVCYDIKAVSTYYEEMKPWRLIKHVVRYLFKRRGMLAFPAAQVGVFLKTDPGLDRPDAQIHFAPAAGEYNESGKMMPVPGTTASVCLLRPTSRGSVHIQSSEPDRYPVIKANYLRTEEDRKGTIAAVRRVREIYAAGSLEKYDGHELTPGTDVQTDEEILDYVRKDAVSVYHPVGSCKMGNDDMAVVDSQLRVRGIDGLRVADASIMPTLISGNTHATCVVIADKCADMMLGG
jgi:choline dehydrogenase